MTDTDLYQEWLGHAGSALVSARDDVDFLTIAGVVVDVIVEQVGGTYATGAAALDLAALLRADAPKSYRALWHGVWLRKAGVQYNADPDAKFSDEVNECI